MKSAATNHSASNLLTPRWVPSHRAQGLPCAGCAITAHLAAWIYTLHRHYMWQPTAASCCHLPALLISPTICPSWPPQRLSRKNNMDYANLNPRAMMSLLLSGFMINFSCSLCLEWICAQGCLFRSVFEPRTTPAGCAVPPGDGSVPPAGVTAAAQQLCGRRLTCWFFGMPSQRTWSWRPRCKQNKRGGHSN